MRLLLLLWLFCLVFAACSPAPPPRVLIFSKTTGYRHQSIEPGRDALVQLCYNNGILADTTEDARYFNEKNLKRYAAVVFLNTNGEVLNPAQEADFERYIQAGGGFMGVHAASATEYTWRWYGGLVGGYFKEHPPMREITLQPQSADHEATCHLKMQPWNWTDEPYHFRALEPDLKILLSAQPELPALSWCHNYDGGRAFYTALGHLPEAYQDTVFQQHLLGGLRYAIGDNKPLRYNRCRTQRLPDQTRFVKTVVASDLAEPMEIAALPDDKLLLIERHGHLKLFNPETGLLQTVMKLPVYSEMGDGLLGVAIDPDWTQNHWIYLYYSSLRDSMNQLSRFVFQGDTLHRASEKVLLTIPVGHKDCFHAAGSLTFDADGNLLLSTGDNTSPFASDGYNPIDERPGRKAFDAQRSSANTADLRGKILRIKPLPNGDYLCPAGNLFTSKDVLVRAGSRVPDARTRPEIYVMGCRNPFRISYDERRKLLFWGDIGSDAGKTNPDRGPMGHDEINRARAAGNFGWPYFTGDNQAYRDFDYANNQSGAYFDANRPLNHSPNNTGDSILPPAQPAFIWYPYSKNRDFPIMGSGGRNAMAGPVYYADAFPSKSRFPDYYDGKLIVYDWMRNWLMAVALDAQDDFYHLEPFAEDVRLNRPMDMLFAQNGSLWLLEYGTRWYSSNEDARLSRIDYVAGNRPPKVVLEATPEVGAASTECQFVWSKTLDYDGGTLQFDLDFGDGTHQRFSHKDKGAPILGPKHPDTTSIPAIRHTYARAGTYVATLRVTDVEGAAAESRCTLHIGNAAPFLRWDVAGHNRSFYMPGDSLFYQLVVEDREDGSLAEGGIAAASVATSLDYLEKAGSPLTLIKKQTQAVSGEKYAEGKRLIDQSDCKNCHAIDRQINGPAYQAIAARYRSNRDFAVPSIYRKIIYGGVGNWGQSIMIPHPNIREEEAIQMALWILSLGDPPKPVSTMPLAGMLALAPETGAFVLRAGYRDQPSNGQPSLETETTLVLRPNTLQAESCDARSEGVGNYKPEGQEQMVLQELKHNAWFVWHQADLVGVKTLTVCIAYGDKKAPQAGGTLEIRRGTRHGAILATLNFESKNAAQMVFETRTVPLAPQNPDVGLQDLFFVFKNPQNQGQSVIAVDWVRFDL